MLQLQLSLMAKVYVGVWVPWGGWGGSVARAVLLWGLCRVERRVCERWRAVPPVAVLLLGVAVYAASCVMLLSWGECERCGVCWCGYSGCDCRLAFATHVFCLSVAVY